MPALVVPFSVERLAVGETATTCLLFTSWRMVTYINTTIDFIRYLSIFIQGFMDEAGTDSLEGP